MEKMTRGTGTKRGGRTRCGRSKILVEGEVFNGRALVCDRKAGLVKPTAIEKDEL
jgi:hypothetical protein